MIGPPEVRRGSSRVFRHAISAGGGGGCRSFAPRAAYGNFPRLRLGCGRVTESYPTIYGSRPNQRGERSGREEYGARWRITRRRNRGREPPFERPRRRGRSARRKDSGFCLRGWRASFRSRRHQQFWTRGVSIGFSAGREICKTGRSNRPRRCFSVRRRGEAIGRRDKRNWRHPRIPCRCGHVERRFCNFAGLQWVGAGPCGGLDHDHFGEGSATRESGSTRL